MDSFLKGGPGSGVKGHKTERLDEFKPIKHLEFKDFAEVHEQLRVQKDEDGKIPIFEQVSFIIGKKPYYFIAESWYPDCMESRLCGLITDKTTIKDNYEKLMIKESGIGHIDESGYVSDSPLGEYGVTWIAREIKDFSKGGPGSGVKGHRTYKEDFKRFKDFFGTPRNYETFKSQGGLELLDKMFEIFGENITKDVLAKTTLSFDDKRTHSDAAGEVCFSSTGEASLRLRDETALFGITHKQKKYIAAHEIGHIAFTNFQLRDSSPLNDSLSEGLAILFSNSIMSSGWENNEYKKHAIQTFNLLKDFSEQEGETVQRSFKSISNLFIDESKIDKNIDKFLKFANKAKIKPLGNISKEFKDVIKEFRSGVKSDA